MQRAIEHIAEEFSKAIVENAAVVIINSDPSVPEEAVLALERHEDLHRVIIAVTEGGHFSERFMQRFLDDTETTGALERLSRMRPDAATPLRLVHEFAVLLMQGRWDEIGLTANKAGDFWYRFAKLLIEEYGDAARAILKHGHPLHAEKTQRI